MSNPWEEIDLNDYENHMSLDTVCQLQALNEMMKEQFDTYDIDSIMILGVAGGNGLEHVSGDRFQVVYGVDINQKYLDECKKRYAHLQGIFETICADLLNQDLQLPHSDYVVANLLIEYIGYDCFQKVIKLVKPRYVSCIIQINTEESFVSDSPYLHVFDRLDEVHHQMEEAGLINCMKEIGYTKAVVKERELPNGKKLVRIDFVEGES